LDGVAGDDFWKNPRMDFWFFMFCVLEDVRFRAAGGVAVGDESEPFAIVDDPLCPYIGDIDRSPNSGNIQGITVDAEVLLEDWMTGGRIDET
jgi:hypothetical protein